MHRTLHICLLALYLLHGLGFSISQLGHGLTHMVQDWEFDGHHHGSHAHHEAAHQHHPALMEMLEQGSFSEEGDQPPQSDGQEWLISFLPSFCPSEASWQAALPQLVHASFHAWSWHTWWLKVPVPPPCFISE